MEHIYTIVINSDTKEKCEWFGYAYSTVFYILLVTTILLIGSSSQSKQKLISGNIFYAWAIVATLSVVFSLVFYTACFQPGY